jgi:hypothetical protein
MEQRRLLRRLTGSIANDHQESVRVLLQILMCFCVLPTVGCMHHCQTCTVRVVHLGPTDGWHVTPPCTTPGTNLHVVVCIIDSCLGVHVGSSKSLQHPHSLESLPFATLHMNSNSAGIMSSDLSLYGQQLTSYCCSYSCISGTALRAEQYMVVECGQEQIGMPD